MNYDDIECPRCKTTKYRNPNLKLLVNVCGHPLCEKCIESMFATGTAKCFQCPTPLKRGNFKRQLFQDSGVEKDIQIRRDILRKFNESPDAFPTLRAYNDYLEKLETIIYNLANDIEIDETKKLIDELRRPKESKKEVVEEKKQPYFHKVEQEDLEGPDMPVIDNRYIKAIRAFTTQEVAGGFTAELAIRRAIKEAFSSLYRSTTMA